MKISVHAGHNPDGKIGSGAVGLIKESTEARKVTKYVVKYLKQAGHTVFNDTVNNGKSQSDVLNKIVAKINAHNVDLAVSLHFNAGVRDYKGNNKVTGTEVYVYALNQKPKAVASKVTNEISKLGFENRGVRERKDLYVLNATNAPAMLVECCFVDDKDDINIYNAKKMAQAIVLGILNSYGVQTYTAKKKINSFNLKLKKNGTIKKAEICQIDKFIFVDGYLLGHRKKANTWAKIKYLKLK